MPKTLGLIHTSATLVPMFARLCEEKLADVDVFNIVDDSLIKDVIRRNQLTPHTARRVVDHVASAESAGADAILVTCSSIGPAAEAASRLVQPLVLRVDQPMADEAIRMGKRIGVLATLRTTLEPTTDLIRRRAAAGNQDVVVAAKLCEGAFEALMSGDSARHHEMIRSALVELAGQVDVIVLAQASMATAAELLAADERPTPILTSPPLAVDYLATVL